MLKRLGIGTKLVGGYVLIALLMAGVGAFTLQNLRTIQNSDDRLYKRVAKPLGELEVISASFQRMRASIRDALLTDDQDMQETYLKLLVERRREVEAAAKDYESGIFTKEGRALFDAFSEAWGLYVAEMDEVARVLRTGTREEAQEALTNAIPRENTARERIRRLVERKVGAGQESTLANARQTEAVVRNTTAALALIILLSLVLGVLLTRAITRPLREMAAVA